MGSLPYAALIVCLSLTTTLANATPKKGHKSAGSQTSKKTTVKYQRSASEETNAERDRRLLRECKGMHNAGACRGYTR